MEEIISKLSEPINQIIVLGVTIAFYMLCYSVRLAGGKRRTKKQKIDWSWERFWNDLHFRLMMGYALVAAVVAVDMAQWLLPLLGWSLSPEAAANLNANLIIALPFIAGLNELQQGIRLLYKVWRYKENLEELKMSADNFSNEDVNLKPIVSDVTAAMAAIMSSINTIHDDPQVPSGNIVSKKETKALAELGSMPYIKLDVSTPAAAYQSLIGKAFDEGWGLQCVAGFKEFMYSLSGRYVNAGGAASGYAKDPARKAVCALGFSWHDGIEGITDGCWGIWSNGKYGHVAMYYQGKWLGQNQGAADANAGNAFNLMALSTVGFMGYFRPNIYAQSASKPATKPSKDPQPTPVPSRPQAPDTVLYTYQTGDTFGEVIQKLGLQTGHGLWGEDGDVNYYTNQLRSQGISGNIPVGTTIKLTRRN